MVATGDTAGVTERIRRRPTVTGDLMAKHSAPQPTAATGVVPLVASTATAYTDRLRGSSLQRPGRHAR